MSSTPLGPPTGSSAVPPTPQATGRGEERAGSPHVAWTRRFEAPIADVWAAVTEPARLERWIGTWEGDPTSGSVRFRMTSEGEDCDAEIYRIEVCEPPRRLVTLSAPPGEEPVWRLTLDLSERDGVTTLVFAQEMQTPALRAMVDSVGPGWEYYLDRLVVAEGGGEVADVVWEAYYPALAESYRALFTDRERAE